MHIGARYYDPKIGRFATRDTYLNQKPYLYCEHDPMNYFDPSGHEIPRWLKGIGAAIVVTTVVVVGAGIIVPGVVGTEVGSVIVGAVAGATAGAAGVGWGSDPDEVTWKNIGTGALQGGIGGGFCGALTGSAPMPWLMDLIRRLK